MAILSKDLKMFRKTLNIKSGNLTKRLGIDNLYGIENKDYVHYSQMYGRLLWIIGLYFKTFRQRELQGFEYKSSVLPHTIESLTKEKTKVGVEIEKLEEQIRTIEEQLHTLKKKENNISNELYKLKNVTGNVELSYFYETSDYFPDYGKSIKGSGITMTPAYIFEEGFYQIATKSNSVNKSLEVFVDQLDREYIDSIDIIESETLQIKEKGPYLFYVFASEGLEWEITIKRFSVENEQLMTDIKELNLSENTYRDLSSMKFKYVEDLTSVTFKALEETFSEWVANEIKGALKQIGLTLKVSEMDDQPIAILNLSSRASNGLERKIKTIGMLLYYSKEDLYRFRGLGKESVNEIINEVEKLGLQFHNKTRYHWY